MLTKHFHIQKFEFYHFPTFKRGMGVLTLIPLVLRTLFCFCPFSNKIGFVVVDLVKANGEQRIADSL